MPDIENLIYEGVCRNEAAQTHRGYLGMSSVGAPCALQAWHGWRQTSGSIMDGRVLLLFELGRKVEEVVCRALRLAGFELEGAFPDPQLSYKDFGGWFSGHPDGLIRETDGSAILEVKSANTGRFKMFQDKGVKEVYPAYYAQMQLYLGYSGCSRALFVVMKKDDSTLYAEWVPFDPAAFEMLKRKAAWILQTHNPDGRIRLPPQISDDPKSEECKWCRYKVACHEPTEHLQTIRTCRSCAYFRMAADWVPWCGYSAHPVQLAAVDRACPQWSWVSMCPF
jgi:hypothetical protein